MSLPDIPRGATVDAWQAETGGAVVGPRDAMILLLHVSWTRWHLYSDLLRQQVDEALQRAGRGQGDRSDGLVGHRLGFSKDGVYETSEEIRALAALDGEERDRCARLAREAHNMGIMDGGW